MSSVGTTFADYEIVQRMGEASHGTFYLARPPARLGISEQHCVLKLVAAGNEDDFRRFSRELRAFASVRSPHLVRLLDAGQDESWFFYAVEHCELGTLAAPTQPLSQRDAVLTVADASLAAHALHESGISHRDIRPSNIQLNQLPAGSPRVCEGKLGDLGLAASTSGTSAPTVATIAAVDYVDPLLIRGEPPSRATDIYSLGASLHFALTGLSVYPGLRATDPLGSVRAVLSGSPTIDPAVPDAAAALIRMCLDPDPIVRPSTAAELAELVQQLAATT